MLAHKHRLPLNKTKFHGKRIDGHLMTLVIRSNSLPHSRWAIIVSKKVSPKAVGRNQIKRRLRHAARTITNICTFSDVLIIAKPTINQSDFAQIKYELKCLINK